MQDYHIFPIRIEKEKYKKLRKIAFMSETSIAKLIREMIDLKLLEKKMLTKRDIAI